MPHEVFYETIAKETKWVVQLSAPTVSLLEIILTVQRTIQSKFLTFQG